jgi:hypothetical protein
MSCMTNTVATVQQKAQTMLWYVKFESIIKFRIWNEEFRETGSMQKDILVGSLGDIMKMWIMFSRRSYRVRRR